LALVAGDSAQAQSLGDAGADAALTGTLKTLRQRGSVIVGYREASVPFSYLSTIKEPIGYSIELCKTLVADLGEAVHRELKVEWVAVTSANRVEAVESGRADIECGSTTNNAERRARVAFSPTIFVAGTKLMVKSGSKVRSFRDLAGKRVAVTAGTTNEKSMHDLSDKFKLNLQFVVSADHDQSLAKLTSGEAEAFATDDVLLYGFIAQKKLKGQVEVVGDLLSYDPYGVMYRKNDPMMARVVNDSFQRMAQDGEIERQYRHWFLRKLPLGESIDLPMSAHLESIIEATARPSE
jgi:glutamate/aspartate transport system substrate-binding protein